METENFEAPSNPYERMETEQKYAARGAEDSSCPVFMLQQAMRTYVRKDEVACVSGKLKSQRSLLEFFKGELDRALV